MLLLLVSLASRSIWQADAEPAGSRVCTKSAQMQGARRRSNARAVRREAQRGSEWEGRPLPATASRCQSGNGFNPLKRKGASDMKITTIGIDLATSLFQVHGVDERGKA